MQVHDSPSRRDFLIGSLALGAAGLRFSSPASAAERSAIPAAAGGWQIGCATRPWEKHELGVAFDAIAEAGFKYVGLMRTKSPSGRVITPETTEDEARRIGEEAKKRGLSVTSVHGAPIPVNQSHEAAVQTLRRTIDRCAAAGAAHLVLNSVADQKHLDAYCKAVRDCCDYAAEKKLRLNIKPHGGLNATGPQCRKVIEQVKHKNFQLWYDPGNIFFYSEGKLDPVDDAPTVDGIVVGMCVKDYLPPKNVDVTPGTGKVNFTAVMSRLRKGGFTGGPLLVETLAPGDLPATLAEARKARMFLEHLVR